MFWEKKNFKIKSFSPSIGLSDIGRVVDDKARGVGRAAGSGIATIGSGISTAGTVATGGLMVAGDVTSEIGGVGLNILSGASEVLGAESFAEGLSDMADSTSGFVTGEDYADLKGELYTDFAQTGANFGSTVAEVYELPLGDVAPLPDGYRAEDFRADAKSLSSEENLGGFWGGVDTLADTAVGITTGATVVKSAAGAGKLSKLKQTRNPLSFLASTVYLMGNAGKWKVIPVRLALGAAVAAAVAAGTMSIPAAIQTLEREGYTETIPRKDGLTQAERNAITVAEAQIESDRKAEEMLAAEQARLDALYPPRKPQEKPEWQVKQEEAEANSYVQEVQNELWHYFVRTDIDKDIYNRWLSEIYKAGALIRDKAPAEIKKFMWDMAMSKVASMDSGTTN